MKDEYQKVFLGLFLAIFSLAFSNAQRTQKIWSIKATNEIPKENISFL